MAAYSSLLLSITESTPHYNIQQKSNTTQLLYSKILNQSAVITITLIYYQQINLFFNKITSAQSKRNLTHREE